VSCYTCPSDYSSGGLIEGAPPEYNPVPAIIPGGVCKVRTASYAAMHGCNGAFAFPELIGNSCQADPSAVALVNGTIVELGNIKITSVTDGLSNTVIVTEKATSLFNQFALIDPTLASSFAWWVAGTPGDTVAMADYPPNAHRLATPSANYDKWVYIWSASASSFHPGGVNVLLGDGSVRFVKDSISSWPLGANQSKTPRGIWQALSTRNGSEIINSDSY
jgi:prepilin-type processing-associated H-X9-DG protein